MLEKGNRANTLHGILLIALFSFAAFYIAGFPFVKRLSLSPLIVGIVLGMLYANSLRNRLPETWVPGIRFCTKQVLRWGIILYGFRLTLTQVAAVGLPAVAVDLVVVAGTLLGGVALGRLLGIDRDTALMTSTGSAICGAAAVLGAEPVVRCEGYKTAVAVSTVVVFGTLSMFLYPVMYRTGLLGGMTDTEVAVYTGSTLHEVAHVAGAGNAMDPTDALGIAGVATITKMIRVMLLAPVLVVMSLLLAGRRRTPGGTEARGRIAVPWFAFGFLGVICLNSLLQYVCGAESVREIPLNGAVEYLDTFLLTMAMTALGTETSIDKFRQAGAKPFVLAGLLYVWLVVGGYFVTKGHVLGPVPVRKCEAGGTSGGSARFPCRCGGNRFGPHAVAVAGEVRFRLRKPGKLRGLVLGVAQHRLADEIGEAAGLVVGQRRRIAHQHQPVLLEGAAERRVDVLVRILDEAEPPVEVQPPDRDFVRRRVDLQNDAPAFAEGREGLRTHVPAAQGGRYGEVFDIVPSVALPVVEDADELVAAPDAVGPEVRIPEGADVVLLGALLLVGERPAVNLHRFGPSPVGGGGKGDELQFFCHGSVFFPQDTTNSVHILIRRRGRRDRIPAGRGSGVRFPEFPQCLPSRFSGCLPDFPDILLRNAGRLCPAMRRRPFRFSGRGVLRCVPPRQFDVGNL